MANGLQLQSRFPLNARLHGAQAGGYSVPYSTAARSACECSTPYIGHVQGVSQACQRCRRSSCRVGLGPATLHAAITTALVRSIRVRSGWAQPIRSWVWFLVALTMKPAARSHAPMVINSSGLGQASRQGVAMAGHWQCFSVSTGPRSHVFDTGTVQRGEKRDNCHPVVGLSSWVRCDVI